MVMGAPGGPEQGRPPLAASGRGELCGGQHSGLDRLDRATYSGMRRLWWVRNEGMEGVGVTEGACLSSRGVSWRGGLVGRGRVCCGLDLSSLRCL